MVILIVTKVFKFPSIITIYIGGVNFVGAFAKLWEATISFFILFVRPSARNNSAPIGRIFTKFNTLNIFRKSVEKIQVSLKSDKHYGYFTWRHIYIYHNIIIILLRMRNETKKKLCRGNQNTHPIFNNFYFRTPGPLWHNVEKYGTARQATDDYMEHALCLLDS
jgi:hypothetical protein